MFLVTDVVALPCKILEFRNGKTFAARTTQRFLPHLTLQHDRVAVEQVFLRPLNGIADRDAILRHYLFTLRIRKLAQRNPFSLAQLRFPQFPKLIATQGFLFS